MRLAVLLIALWPWPVFAGGDRAGVFDYWVLALSWSPTYCALDGAARDDPQCDRVLGWVVHGLWPQYDIGWPNWCDTTGRDPSRAETSAMADIMGSAGSAWHQWKKHGRCSGLSPDGYFALVRKAHGQVRRPKVLRRISAPTRLPASAVEQAFLAENPGLALDMVTIICRAGRIQEARLCLDRDLRPRRCGRDVRRDCAATDALLAPMR